jgi:energy-coupling factor transporter ATP-binding protein EcfA2
VLDVMTGLAQEGMTMICVTHEMGFAREVALSKLARQLDAGELRGRIIILPALGYPRWKADVAARSVMVRAAIE